jgi:hypothetical protein
MLAAAVVLQHAASIAQNPSSPKAPAVPTTIQVACSIQQARTEQHSMQASWRQGAEKRACTSHCSLLLLVLSMLLLLLLKSCDLHSMLTPCDLHSMLTPQIRSLLAASRCKIWSTRWLSQQAHLCYMYAKLQTVSARCAHADS